MPQNYNIPKFRLLLYILLCKIEKYSKFIDNIGFMTASHLKIIFLLQNLTQNLFLSKLIMNTLYYGYKSFVE